MSATISMFLRGELLRHYFMSRPGSYIYAAVTQTVGLANSPGDLLTEPSGNGYGRPELPCDEETWGLTGLSELSNLVEIPFPDHTDEWGYIGGWALLDAPASGMTLAVGSMVVPGELTAEMPPLSLTVGACTIGLYD